jgi:hypothetical protein
MVKLLLFLLAGGAVALIFLLKFLVPVPGLSFDKSSGAESSSAIDGIPGWCLSMIEL